MIRLQQQLEDVPSSRHGRGLLVYAHYDHEARIRAYVRHALDAARAQGLYTIAVTTNVLEDAQRTLLEQHCDRLIIRPENTGFDFYSWKVALEQVDLAAFEFVITTNSSILWPIGDPAPALDRIFGSACDFVGINRSLETAPHIQSYFLLWRKPLIHSSFFRKFWQDVPPYIDKWDVVLNLECRLEALVQQAGFSTATLIDPNRFLWRHAPVFGRQLRRVATNPTMRYPLEMLHAGSPCLKLSVLQLNPYRVDLKALRAECLARGYPSGCMDDFYARFLA